MFFLANKYKLNFNKIFVMGILNITPDSFSDGGFFFDLKHAIKRAKQIQDEGADIIDVGAQSTRPGFKKIDEKKELERLIPVLKELIKFIKIPVSIDTFYPKVAEEAIKFKIDIINDVTGFLNPSMLNVVSKSDCGMIVMHNSEKWNKFKNNYSIRKFFFKQIENITKNFKINKERICLDPGIGFGKSSFENLYIVSNIDKFKIRNYPILLGLSKKKFISQALNDFTLKTKTVCTTAIHSFLVDSCVNILRVHDVKDTIDTLNIINKLKKFKENI